MRHSFNVLKNGQKDTRGERKLKQRLGTNDDQDWDKLSSEDFLTDPVLKRRFWVSNFSGFRALSEVDAPPASSGETATLVPHHAGGKCRQAMPSCVTTARLRPWARLRKAETSAVTAITTEPLVKTFNSIPAARFPGSGKLAARGLGLPGLSTLGI